MSSAKETRGGVQFVQLEAWPPGARLLALLAQTRGDELHHEIVSGIHVASVVLEMMPARRLLGERSSLAPLDGAVERALLLAAKSHGKAATIGGVLAQTLAASRPVSTAAILRAAVGETALLAKLRPAFDEHADAIAAVLDAPLLRELCVSPFGDASAERCPSLYAGAGLSRMRKHRAITTRHVIAAVLLGYVAALDERGLGDLGDAPARAQALLERESTAPATGLRVGPRLVGALGGAIASANAEDEFSLPHALVAECLEGDDEVDFARDAMEDAKRRMGIVKRVRIATN